MILVSYDIRSQYYYILLVFLLFSAPHPSPPSRPFQPRSLNYKWASVTVQRPLRACMHSDLTSSLIMFCVGRVPGAFVR